MKKGDVAAVGYVLAYAAIVMCFPLTVAEGSVRWSGFCAPETGLPNFGRVVGAWPYVSGFLKVGLLATFGEMLKVRMRTGSWKTPALLPKLVIWGVYGMLFSLVFALFAIGVQGLSKLGLWWAPADYAYATATWPQRIYMGFSISLWCNLIFCYPMMLSHEWFNRVVTEKRLIGGAEFLGSLDAHVWGSFMLKTIVYFWIPAHTVTFSLPPNYRVLMSAVLSLALGFILTVRPHHKKA